MKNIKEKVLIIGGKSKARSLALSLIKQGYSVTVINKDQQYCTELAETAEINVFNGDGTKPYILEYADASNHNIAIALTLVDEDNLMICELCKKGFNIDKTFALVSDSNKIDFFHKAGVDSVVCPTSIIANIIEQQAFVKNMTNVIPVGKGHVQITEVPVTNTSPVVGKKVWEIDLPKEVLLGSILRGETTLIPRGDTNILAGDILVLISGNGKEQQALDVLVGVL